MLVILAALLCISFAREDRCVTCRKLNDKFNEGLKKTEKSTFDGGDADWEKKTLQLWATSETRFAEIMEQMCSRSDNDCLSVLEHAEDHIETFWKQMETKTSFFDYVCVMKLRTCCQEGHYGKDCQQCPGGSQTPCNGNGVCDGNGLRSGKGKCNCTAGYEGKSCEYCRTGYFALGSGENEKIKCAKCDESCRKCNGPDNTHCTQCEDGYESVNGACVDVDECTTGAHKCATAEFCTNTKGNYTCAACDKTCATCRGNNETDCISCHAGFDVSTEGKCEDLDECKHADACPLNKYCMNLHGSKLCIQCDTSCDKAKGCTFGGPSGCNECKSGYVKYSTGTCMNINECLSSPCPERFTCTDTEGSFTCECKSPNTLVDGVCQLAHQEL